MLSTLFEVRFEIFCCIRTHGKHMAEIFHAGQLCLLIHQFPYFEMYMKELQSQVGFSLIISWVEGTMGNSRIGTLMVKWIKHDELTTRSVECVSS